MSALQTLHQSYLLAGGQASSANVVCPVPSYFRALLGLQASKHFQQVAGPPQVPPLERSGLSKRRQDRIGRNAYAPGVRFQLCLPLWHLQDDFTEIFYGLSSFL